MNTRLDLLQHLVKTRGVRSYLEIGLAADRVFAEIGVPCKVGVDPEQGGTYRGTSDMWFAHQRETRPHKEIDRFDLVFVDGLHEATQALRDVEHSLGHLTPSGVIVLHDCNPWAEWAQRVPRPLWRLESGERYERPWTGDVWKAWVQLRCRPDLDCACLDADYGCGVVLRRENTKPVTNYWSCTGELVYANLEEHRQEWLRLMSAEELVEWIG